MYIREEDIQEFFFHKLIEAGLAPESGDLDIISEIFIAYLIKVGLLEEDNYIDEDDFEEE